MSPDHGSVARWFDRGSGPDNRADAAARNTPASPTIAQPAAPVTCTSVAGLNYYPVDTRNHRFNLQVMDVDQSPVSSTFGYYVGGQNGTTVSAAFSVFF